MVIIKVNGGLGNQLQQYALYEKFKALHKEVRLDISWYEQDNGLATERKFDLQRFPNISYQLCTREEYSALIQKDTFLKKCLGKIWPSVRTVYAEFNMYDSAIFAFDDKILEGYWACEAYYADIMSTLRERLQFSKPCDCANIELALKMESEESVSIHIRRGDYLNSENAAVFGNICTEAYYRSAIAYIRQRTANPVFYVFSDDSDYAKEKYQGEEFKIVDWNHGDDSIYDMYLMSKCKHNICANSTFSFWGARLNCNSDKLVIRPLKQKNTMVYETEQMRQLWNGWILIGQDGKCEVDEWDVFNTQPKI